MMTTDERFVRVADGDWWDTSGIDLVAQSVVDRHLAANPDVGLMVVRLEDAAG